MSSDVLIIGAGVAGLSAAIDLAGSGLRVEMIEARDRVGGRVFTVIDPVLKHAVELGAEFVHGLSPEIWQPLQRHNLKLNEVEGDLWCSIQGRLEECNFFSPVAKILEAMDDRGPDESFLDFLARRFRSDSHRDAKQWATRYVSGFNAADPGLVSVHWLVHSRLADEQIEGDRAFHIAGGYERLLDVFLGQLKRPNVCIHLKTIFEGMHWRPGAVELHALRDDQQTSFSAPRALITVPLGVLQGSDSVRFEPALPGPKQSALKKLAMGKVVRITLCFRERFWEKLSGIPDSKSLRDLSFLFSADDLFPTWWTQMPEPVPVITAWAPARSAESLAQLSKEAILDKAVESLSGVLAIGQGAVESQLRTAYFHDWDSDPFSRGAYSYVKAGGEGWQRTLGAPLDRTLFFAGEATDTSGHNGTVHGAIASGRRAAREIRNSL
jgi:monoamine oxidase